MISRFSHIGLDVGSRSIKAVQFARGRNGYSIVGITCMDRKASGAALSADEALELRAVLGRQGFRGRTVVVGGAASKLLCGAMELPPRSSGAPLDQIARIELARAHACPPDSIEFAWWELPAGTRANEGTHVFAIGIRNTDANEALDGLEAAGFEVAALDSGTLGLVRGCVRLGVAKPGHATGLLDLGWNEVTLAVLLGDTLVYHRFLPEMGLSRLHKRLVTELSVDPEAAEFVIRRVGVSEELPEEQRHWELLADARAILVDHTETIAKELKASLAYATRRYGATASTGVVASGGGASVPGLVERLRHMLEEPVQPLSPALMATPPADPLAAALASDPRLACAAGLALEPARTATPEAVNA